MRPADVWEALDPAAAPVLVWIRPVAASEAVFLLGAFDPPTLAHLAVVRAAARRTRMPPALCLTKVLLDRTSEPLLDPAQRLDLLERLASELGAGVAVCSRGTYVEVAAAARASGVEPAFVVGSDKLPQLEDPSFYPDGAAGVARTFAQVRFIVVPRGVPIGDRRVEVLAAHDVFETSAIASASATSVRERIRRGQDVTDLVPPAVALALRGYTVEAEPT